MAHDAAAYTTAMTPSEVYVAIGTVRRGFFDSSENTADASNPTKPSSAVTSSGPMPGAPHRSTGLRLLNEMPSAGFDRPPAVSTRTTTTSAVGSTASTTPLRSTRSRPRTVTMAHAASASQY